MLQRCSHLIACLYCRDVFLVESGIAEAYVPDVKNPVEFFPEGSFFGEVRKLTLRLNFV